ncbi:MAG: efflux RND transporter periplasmic adaptor subunit [Acidobacteria bacterium]|nr:efflux RND transporter periplasmic adaptor subunit [Acidobacteriota bacterium]
MKKTILSASRAAALLASLSLLTVGCGKNESDGPPAAGGGGGKGGEKKGGEVPVTVAKAVAREVPIELEVIGNVEASSMVMIKPQVSGELTKAFFKEGDFVKAGAPLFEIDRRALDAQLAQAQANLLRSEAMNRQAQATVAKSRAQLAYLRDQATRYAQLAKEGIFSKEQNQQAESTAQAQQEAVAADLAAIESTKADIAAQRAVIDSLKVQLGFTQIRSPLSGRTGTLLVKVGNIVSANTTELVQINQVDPLFVSYAIPESQLNMVESRFGKSKIPVFAISQDGSDSAEGVLNFYDNTVDPSTGTIRLRATFANPGRKLWPGQFVRVRTRLGSDPNAIVVPNQAVQTGPDGQFIFVVKEDRRVEMRTVTTGARSGNDLVIATGLQAGETVVSEGQMRLAPGMRVGARDGSKKGGKKGGGEKKEAPKEGTPKS